MTLTDAPFLLDVNVVIALLFEDHEHHRAASDFFATPGLSWAICPWTEAGFVRYATRIGELDVAEASGVLERLARHPGYRFHPIAHDWRTLSGPLLTRVHGHRQVTDTCLLGLAIKDGLVLVTFDRGILQLARGHQSSVHLLSRAEAEN